MSSLSGQFELLADSIRRRLYMTETFDGSRNVWESCGYPAEVQDEAMEKRYRRMGLARQIVDAYPNYCWLKDPQVVETEDDKTTKFEKAWTALCDGLPLFDKLSTLDRLAGRGTCTVMLVGFDDGKNLEMELGPGSWNVTFLRPYHPSKVVVEKKETSMANPRYGQPTMYRLKTSDSGSSSETMVHWTRVLHLADETEDREWIGEHRLLKVFNHILDIEKIVGGGSEMFWKGGFPGMGFMMPSEQAALTDEQKTELNEEIEQYFHGLSRYFKLRGIQAEQFTPQVADPAGHFKINIQLISAATGIPTRILLGSEEAKYASIQDIGNWLDRVKQRQFKFCEHRVLRPFIQMLIRSGTLPAPKQIRIRWPDLQIRTDKEEADVAKTRTEAYATYASTPGIENVLDLFHYLTEVQGMPQEKANAIVARIEADLDAEDDDAEDGLDLDGDEE